MAAPAATTMIDREKVLTVLRRRFPGGTPDDFAAAANAIVGLPEEWEDVTILEPNLLAHLGRRCGDRCILADALDEDVEFRILRRRPR
jgi:hypothetical protein